MELLAEVITAITSAMIIRKNQQENKKFVNDRLIDSLDASDAFSCEQWWYGAISSTRPRTTFTDLPLAATTSYISTCSSCKKSSNHSRRYQELLPCNCTKLVRGRNTESKAWVGISFYTYIKEPQGTVPPCVEEFESRPILAFHTRHDHARHEEGNEDGEDQQPDCRVFEHLSRHKLGLGLGPKCMRGLNT